MRIRALNHMGFSVGDLDRSVRFYTELLGVPPYFRERYDVPYIGRMVGYPGAIQEAAFFRLPEQADVFLELIQYLEPAAGAVRMEAYNAGNAHLCLTCEDLDAEYARLAAVDGVSFRSDGPVSSDYGVYTGARGLFLRDPDGILIQLVEIPPDIDPAGRR
jgi:catechol 2,3-dioxygenase-like lactoylglutathione lyase family enzyme